MYEFIKYETVDGVTTITLNRPDVYNALNDEITYELQDAFKKATREEETRVVVFTGEGKAFCSGQDLKAASGDQKRSFSASLEKRYNPLITLMRKMPKPIICKINGVAAGKRYTGNSRRNLYGGGFCKHWFSNGFWLFVLFTSIGWNIQSF